MKTVVTTLTIPSNLVPHGPDVGFQIRARLLAFSLQAGPAPFTFSRGSTRDRDCRTGRTWPTGRGVNKCVRVRLRMVPSVLRSMRRIARTHGLTLSRYTSAALATIR